MLDTNIDHSLIYFYTLLCEKHIFYTLVHVLELYMNLYQLESEETPSFSLVAVIIIIIINEH